MMRLVVCPIAWCNWTYRYEPSDRMAKADAVAAEKAHYADFHARSMP